MNFMRVNLIEILVLFSLFFGGRQKIITFVQSLLRDRERNIKCEIKQRQDIEWKHTHTPRKYHAVSIKLMAVCHPSTRCTVCISILEMF